jgi:sodium/proline symporter
MFAALLAVPIIIVATQNMDTAALAAVYSYQDAVSGEMVECAFGTGIFDASWQEIVSGLAWGLGYFGMPHILVRFMSIEKPSMVKKSATVAIVWVVLSLGATCLIAYFGRMLLAEELLTIGAQKTVFIAFARMLFPSFIAGILMAAIIAASMSTADSQLLAAASSVSQDLAQDFLGIKLSNRQQMRAARLTVLAIAAVAVVLAWNPNSSVFRVVSFAWAGFGAGFGPQMLLALFWRRSNKQGAIAGMIAGAAMVIIWKFMIAPIGGWFAIYELLPAFLISLACNVCVSLATPEPDKSILSVYDEVHKE